jgi:4a-hydroxytetrahydrobiopterin dehydratase
MSRTNGHLPLGVRKERRASLHGPIAQWFAKWKRAGIRSNGSPLTREQIAALLPQVPHWRVAERNGITRLERVFVFPDLAGALTFAIQVGAVAETEGHHPAMLVEHNQVKVSWWTLSKGGLLQNDFAYAAKTDALYPD